MNYRDVVDRIRQVVFDHKMLVDFGYGQLSDIKTRSEGEGEAQGADYPYLFLNPVAHQRTETEIAYNFNMIVMDMAREEEGDVYENFLGIQSNCMQYIDDVVARLYYHYKDKPEIQFNYSYTPFYERFQDDLAGATANIQIVVPTNINDCITPFDTWELVYDFNLPGGNAYTGYNEFILGSAYQATQGQYRVELEVNNWENLEPLPADANISVGWSIFGQTEVTALDTVSIPSNVGAVWSRSLQGEVEVPAGQTYQFTSWSGDLNEPEINQALKLNSVTTIKVYKRQ